MLHRVLKVLLESFAVALAVQLVSRKTFVPKDFAKVGLTTAAVLIVLGFLAPDVKHATKSGMGLGLGLRQVGFEGYGNMDALEYYSGQKSAIEGFDEDARHVRLNNVLYSGDIVLISGVDTANQNKFIQRNVTSSEILLNAPVNDIQTNLSKLRFEAIDHDPQSLKPLKYGDTVYMKHNAEINNQNVSRFIKMSNNLLSHQTGPLFNQFQIFNATNPADTTNVQPEQPVVIKNLKSGGVAEGYMVVGQDSKIVNSAGAATDGTKFSIKLQRVAEIGDKQNCICEGETLFP